MFTAVEKLKSLEFELRRRTRVFGNLVEQGRMTAHKREYELAIMAEIVDDYRQRASAPDRK